MKKMTKDEYISKNFGISAEVLKLINGGGNFTAVCTYR